MNLSADDMVATKRTFIDLRGYVIAFGLYHSLTGKCLDSRTATRFPNNKLHGGEVVRGRWIPADLRVCFYRDDSSDSHSRAGARQTVSVSPMTS